MCILIPDVSGRCMTVRETVYKRMLWFISGRRMRGWLSAVRRVKCAQPHWWLLLCQWRLPLWRPHRLPARGGRDRGSVRTPTTYVYIGSWKHAFPDDAAALYTSACYLLIWCFVIMMHCYWYMHVPRSSFNRFAITNSITDNLYSRNTRYIRITTSMSPHY